MNSPDIELFRHTDQTWPRLELEDLPLGEIFETWRRPPPEALENGSWQDNVAHIVSEAAKCGNAHNKQPWLVGVDTTTKTLTTWVNPDEIGTPSDRVGRQAHIGLGCFAANLAIALTAFELPVSYTIKSSDQTKIQFDLTQLQTGRLTHPHLLNLLNARRSYRGPFISKHKIPIDISQTITSLGTEENLELIIHSSAFTKTALAVAQVTANNVVLAQPAFRHELGLHLMPNDTNHPKSMPGATFGLSDADAAEVHAALLTDDLFPGKFAAGFTQGIRDATLSCSGVGIISAPDDTPTSWIKTGVLLERTWLYAQSQGLALWISAGLIEAHAMYRNKLKQIIQSDHMPTALFLIGKPRLDTWPHSPRAEVAINSL